MWGLKNRVQKQREAKGKAGLQVEGAWQATAESGGGE